MSFLRKSTETVTLRSEATKDLQQILHFAMLVQNDPYRNIPLTVVC